MNTDCMVVDAQYKDTGVKRYADNPLIETLPPIWSPDEMEQLLSWNLEPPTNEDRIKPAYLRVHEVPEIRSLVYLLPEYTLYQSIFSVLLRDGYTSRNPMDVRTWQYLHEINVGSLDDLKAPAPIDHRASGILFSGLSGMGKTTFINRLLANYPIAIQHMKYNNKPFHHLQIVWIKISCPHDGSLRSLVRKFFVEVDKIAGTRFTQDYFPKSGRGPAIPVLIGEMSRIAADYFLGLLVIDELQNLNRAKTQGDEGMLEFLGSLVDEIGVPVIGIGTPAVTKLFKKELRIARRATSLGYYEFHRPVPEDPAWNDFLDTLWTFDWTDNPTTLTPNLRYRFYEHTQGITALAVALYILAQYRCLLEGESISVELLDEIAAYEMASIQAALRALRSTNKNIQKEFDDLLPSEGWLDHMTDPYDAVERAIDLMNTEKFSDSKKNKKGKKISPDVTISTNKSDPKDIRKLPQDINDAHHMLRETGLTPVNPFILPDTVK